MRAEADALEEQLRSSVEKLATLRHELFQTPATTVSQASRAVPFDELLQYATHISKYTVPPTYRERVPEATEDKDSLKEDAVSSAAPTNGLNTPALALEAAEAPPEEATPPENDGEATKGPAAEITAEEEEWLKKLKDSQIAWYPWPSNDKIRAGNLYKLQYYREKHYNLDEFNIPAYEESERLKNMPGAEEQEQTQEQEQELELPPIPAQVPPPTPLSVRPSRPKEAFTLFDDMEDD